MTSHVGLKYYYFRDSEKLSLNDSIYLPYIRIIKKACPELVPLSFCFHQFHNEITWNEFTDANTDHLLMIWGEKES